VYIESFCKKLYVKFLITITGVRFALGPDDQIWNC